MAKWLYIDLSVFACVAVLTGIIIPQILLIAFRRNLFDSPDPRKIHKTEIPRLGGISFFPSIIFSLFLLVGIGSHFHDMDMLQLLDKSLQHVCFLTCGAIILYLTGMADDLVGVRYRAKFFMQTFAASLILFGGNCLNNMHGFLGFYEIPEYGSILMTVLLTVFIINAINLIDGIDGLASGLSSIACIYYAFVFYQVGLYIFSAIAVATLGALLPFFIYNVFGNPAKRSKIFMGDTGALTIGLFLSVMSIRISRIDMLPDGSNAAVVAFAPLLIPCFDVVRVYIHRLKAGRNPFLPDKTHIHHKLLALGMPQRYAMMSILSSSILLSTANYFASRYVDITWLFGMDLMLWIVVNTFLTRSIHLRERRLSVALYE